MRSNVELYDIWIIQEPWLYSNTLIEFAGLSVNYDYKAISDMHDGDIVDCGRPKVD